MDATLDIALLRTLIAIDEHGGFGRAAEALHRSQPTVSQHVRVLEQRLGLGGGRGHRTFAGTPLPIADTIQTWFENGAADGFNIMPAVLPSGLEACVEKVLPILRERGLFRTECEGSTLREHYGLPRPVNQRALAVVG